MVMRSGQFNERVSFRRFSSSDDGFSKTKVWADLGAPVWAQRRDVSDGERLRAGVTEATITRRFRIRFSAFTVDITAEDRLVWRGQEFEIFGVKELDLRAVLEVTAGQVIG